MKYTFISLYFLQSILSVKYTEKYTLECSKFSILLVYFFNVLYVYFKYTFFFKKVYLKYILSVQTKYTWNILFFCVGCVHLCETLLFLFTRLGACRDTINVLSLVRFTALIIIASDIDKKWVAEKEIFDQSCLPV